MKKLMGFLSGAVIVLTVSSCVDTKRAKNYNLVVDGSSVAFIQQGLENGQTEIKASKVAQSNSKDPRVINFAKMIIDDHAKAGDELEKIAINNKVPGGDSISVTHQKVIGSIAALSGNEFDKAYLKMIVDNHEAAVRSFDDATKDNMDDIRRFAKKTLPVLKMHLDSANAISASLK